MVWKGNCGYAPSIVRGGLRFLNSLSNARSLVVNTSDSRVRGEVQVGKDHFGVVFHDS